MMDFIPPLGTPPLEIRRAAVVFEFVDGTVFAYGADYSDDDNVLNLADHDPNAVTALLRRGVADVEKRRT